MKSKDEYDFSFNVKLIGSAGSGKGSLILKFADNTFTGLPTKTQDVIYKTKILPIEENKVKLSIWDSKACLRWNTGKYNNNQATLITVDVTNKNSFNELEHHINEIKDDSDKYDHNHNNHLIIVVATKYGDENTVVDYQDLINACEKSNVHLTCVNAKTGFNVESLFENCATLLLYNKFYPNVPSDQAKTPACKNLANAYQLEKMFLATHTKHYRYRCLAVIQGKNQIESPIHYLPNEILDGIFSMLPHYGKNESFAAVIFCGMLQQIHTMTFVDSYSKSQGYKSSDSKSFVNNLRTLCEKEPQITTKEQIEKSIATFAAKKISSNEGDCRAVSLLTTHGLFTPTQTEQKNVNPTRDNCVIC